MTAAEQLEQAAERYADELRVSTAIPGALVPMLHDIAREYAEEIVKAKELTGKDVDMLVEVICSNSEMFLRWLLQRYALVEKNKLKNTHQYIMNKIKVGENLRRKKTIDEGKAQRAIFDALFPEIAKEAEK